MQPLVFEAVADPTRRSLLDRLRSHDALSLSALADGQPMTRQAVAKHLDLLRQAGLITTWRRGRERMHALDAAPLRQMDDWLAPYAAAWDRRLAQLKRHVEEPDQESGFTTPEHREGNAQGWDEELGELKELLDS